MERCKKEDIIYACLKCELISKCPYALKPHHLAEGERSNDGLGHCKMLKESELDINYPYQYGYFKAKSEEQAEEINRLKEFLFDLAYCHPRNNKLQSFIDSNFYRKEYENYSLNRKKSAEE